MTGPEIGVKAGRVLVVCTGNVCRSPFIEGMLRLSLPPSIQVTSAGTAALVGAPMDSRVSAQLRRHGLNLEDFAARQLTPGMVRAADLVLAATRAHRAAVATLHPGALRYAFALADFCDLAHDVAAEDLAAPPDGCWVGHIATIVALRRGMVPPRSADEVDIIDPYGQEDRVFAAMVIQVLEALPSVVRLLTESGGARA